jgi:hypothetical protein
MQYLNVLKASGDAIWNLAREPNLNVFAVNWAGPPQTDVDQNQDNAACMGLSLYASLAGAYPGSGIPANQYEAENAISPTQIGPTLVAQSSQPAQRPARQISPAPTPRASTA